MTQMKQRFPQDIDYAISLDQTLPVTEGMKEMVETLVIAIVLVIFVVYLQHNPFIPGSRTGLRGFVENLPKGRSYEPGMAVAEGDLVMIHGRYSGGTGKTLIAIDIFRFEDDRVVEHWDVLQEEVPVDKTVAGNPMFMSVARKN